MVFYERVVLPDRASLYERPVNLDSAKAAHADFRRVMREHGVKVPNPYLIPLGLPHGILQAQSYCCWHVPSGYLLQKPE